MIKVHHLEQSRSLRILWLLEELGLTYEFETYRRDLKTMRAPATMHDALPMAKSPIIEDDGQFIVESGAIIDYITQVKAGGKLAHSPESSHYAEYQQWMHFVEGSMMPPLVYDMISKATGSDSEGLAGFIQGEAKIAFDHAEQHLSQHDFLVADAFSAADVNMSFALEFGEVRGVMKNYPALQAYLARLHERPAYKAVRAKGGNYDLSIFGIGAA